MKEKLGSVMGDGTQVFVDTADIETVDIRVTVQHLGGTRAVEVKVGKNASASDIMLAARSLLDKAVQTSGLSLDRVLAKMNDWKPVPPIGTEEGKEIES